MANSFNWVDYALIGVFLLSILGGLSRGGIKEIISLLTWIAAFFVAGAFATRLASYFTHLPSVQSTLSSASGGVATTVVSHASAVAIGISFLLIFFFTIIVGAIVGSIVSAAVSASGLGVINRLLGAVFGFGRGFLANLVIVFIVQLSSVGQQPFWTQSLLVKEYQPAVTWFANFIQPGLASLKSKVNQTLQDISNGVQSAGMSVFQGN